MVKVIHYKVKGSTLLEVIVALVIIMFVFGIAMMIYLNVLQSSYSNRLIQANLLLKAISDETIREKKYVDEYIQRNGWTVKKSIVKYQHSNCLIHLHLETMDSLYHGKVINRDELIIEGDDKN
jgi:Tfp pilus assembly protein PilV